jgi:hypothetical protein
MATVVTQKTMTTNTANDMCARCGMARQLFPNWLWVMAAAPFAMLAQRQLNTGVDGKGLAVW